MTADNEGMPPAGESGSSGLSKDEKNLGMLCHLIGIIFPVIGPLVIWLIKKDEMAFVDYNGKEALNFQITIAICWVISSCKRKISFSSRS